VGSSGLPTVLNSITNKLEVRQGFIFVQCVRARKMAHWNVEWLGRWMQEAANDLHILASRKRTMSILHDVSGIVKPGR
jgi:hypothetical protein